MASWKALTAAAIGFGPFARAGVDDDRQVTLQIVREGGDLLADAAGDDPAHDGFTGDDGIDIAALQHVGHLREADLNERHLFVVYAVVEKPVAEQHLQEGADARRTDLLADEIVRLGCRARRRASPRRTSSGPSR